MRTVGGQVHRTFEEGCLAQSLAATLALLPEQTRKTICEDGTVVSTIHNRGMYETLAFYTDGGQSEVRLTHDHTRMLLDHDTLVANHGGRS